jgi:hypothetical protein
MEQRILILLVLKTAKKIPTKTPKNKDNKVNSIVKIVAFSNLGKLSIIKSI